MKCKNCNGSGVVSSCDMRRGALCTNTACVECNGTGKIK